MAYPFAQMPTVSEFITLVSEKYEVTIDTAPVIGPKGPDSGEHFVREFGDRKKLIPLPVADREERLTPTVLRSLCAGLEVPLVDFGLTLEGDATQPATVH